MSIAGMLPAKNPEIMTLIVMKGPHAWNTSWDHFFSASIGSLAKRGLTTAKHENVIASIKLMFSAMRFENVINLTRDC